MSEPLHKEIRVRCSQRHAFRTFTERIDLWWPAGHRFAAGASIHLEVQPGGRFYAATPDGDQIHLGEVLECNPPNRIRYTWTPGGGVGPTTVEVNFHPQGDETVVRVEHRVGDSELGAEWPNRARGFSRAWNDVLASFSEQIGAPT